MHDMFVSRFEDDYQRIVALCKTAGRSYDSHILLYNDLCSIRLTGSIICLENRPGDHEIHESRKKVKWYTIF